MRRTNVTTLLRASLETGPPGEATVAADGAIALGHPLGASGGRLATTAINQLHKGGGRRALCTMYIGVGQGIAVILERV
jgi:acetyl-CoA acetyltransferase